MVKKAKSSGITPPLDPYAFVKAEDGKSSGQRFWLAYDLGIDGDHTGLFTWLDQIGAVECGGMTCSFQMDAGAKDPEVAVLAEIKKQKIKLRSKDRIYLIWRRKKDGRLAGKFIHGNRQSSPWTGYASQDADEDTDG